MATVIDQRGHLVAEAKPVNIGPKRGDNPHHFHAGGKRWFMLVLMLVAAHQDIGKTYARGRNLNKDFPRLRRRCFNLCHAERGRTVKFRTDKSAHLLFSLS